ncbi:MAG: T9SS type A sorting domain-containing protein [Ferruginibacter sp.]
MKKLIYIAVIILAPVCCIAQIKNVLNSAFASDTIAKPLNNVLIYPNPSNGSVRIIFPNANINATGGSMIIFDKMGKPVYVQNHVNTTEVQLHLEFLEPGIYPVLFGTGENQFTQKIVIAK